MRTDTLFYQLFQTFHTLLFELTEQPVATAEGYEFVSVEVKEKALELTHCQTSMVVHQRICSV